jgi:hypothetical protein
MIQRAGFVIGVGLSAVVAVLPARAQQSTQGATERSKPSASGDAGAPTPQAEPDRRLLMSALDRAGLAEPLEDAGVRLFGYVEGSYTYNPDPTDHFQFGDISLDRLFDTESNQPLLNQLNLTAERAVRLSGDRWDVGFRAELIYGADARFIHANGLNFYGEGAPLGNGITFQEHPENQFDLFQAYVDVGVPVGDGLVVRLGKFESLFGGLVDPNGNTFYSRSLVFATSHPFTFTGALARYQLTRNLLVEAGFSRGWNQALEDNNDAIDAVARVVYRINEKTIVGAVAVTGPEQDDDNDNYRTLLEATARYQATDRLRLVLTGTYGQEAHVTDPNASALGERDARWYAVAGYTNLQVNEVFSFNTRLEFLRDEKGFNTDLPGNTVSGTLGLTVLPFPHDRLGKNFKLRPEVRLDYSTHERYGGKIDAATGFDPDSNSQLTFGIDAIYNF